MPRPKHSCPARRPLLRHLGQRVALCAPLILPTAAAANESQLWSVHAFGLKVGELRVATSQTSTTYKGRGAFKTTGLAGILKRIRFEIAANGAVRQASLVPAAYDGSIDTGRRVSETKLRFANGLPTKTAGAQDPETPIPDTAKQDAIDPMTMMWLTLRDQTDATLCQLDQTQFDGTRLVRITLKNRDGDANKVTCSGTYDRIGGYSADELAELKTSPLSITYERVADMWQASEIHLTSRHGKAKLFRKD
ncbi:hypothetical protein shim_22460 [Shimia sp. SK013]|uniref:DUF3108 domain-containing protein n=1 Tax=Shimia sp. SK013 TaxID=1389006 RepID=UPI0006B691AD|nr:DUF3108 domain-containing protein [Shimia sp. SK013]KPA21539.1 hypothetical protein shim_22460 [Shimia sp. SK013]